MGAFITANLAVLEELAGHLTDFLASLDEDALNWSPLAVETNSIAALATHIAGSLDNWFGRAVGEPVRRDRDAEFSARSSAADLVARIDDALTTVRRRCRLLEEIDPATVYRVQRLSRNEVSDLTVAWCVEHAVIHTGEHWGQIQLTRQLYLDGRRRAEQLSR